jgi:hypothetical protein
MLPNMNEEDLLIRSFVIPAKRERLIGLLANARRRKSVLGRLAHFRDLDPRWVILLARGQAEVESIMHALKLRGAPDSCHVISENLAFDGRRFRPAVVLDDIVGMGAGTLISCVPGLLGYYEGEDPSDRCILSRTERPAA